MVEVGGGLEHNGEDLVFHEPFPILSAEATLQGGYELRL
jgi:hypothetical protein